MIHIIGVDHLIQYRNGIVPPAIYDEFGAFLRDRAARLGARVLAEEFNEEALTDWYGGAAGTVRDLARDLGLVHRFCDPGEADRRRLGLPWYAEIRDGVKARRGLPPGFILDDSLRRAVEAETRRLDRETWRIREAFWLSRLDDCRGVCVIFVCGHEHVRRFAARCRWSGHGADVIDPFWRRDLFQDYRSLGLP